MWAKLTYCDSRLPSAYCTPRLKVCLSLFCYTYVSRSRLAHSQGWFSWSPLVCQDVGTEHCVCKGCLSHTTVRFSISIIIWIMYLTYGLFPWPRKLKIIWLRQRFSCTLACLLQPLSLLLVFSGPLPPSIPIVVWVFPKASSPNVSQSKFIWIITASFLFNTWPS